LPEAFLDAEHERVEKDKVPCGDCHSDMWQPPIDETESVSHQSS